MGQDGPKKIAIISVCSLLLVALIVAVLFAGHNTPSNNKVKPNTSQKAIAAICQTTDYHDTCFKSLDGQNSSDPKQLIQAAMQSTIAYLRTALQNSTALKQAQTDPRARAALDDCGELANLAIHDLDRSFAKFSQFDITNVDDILMELKTWISGSMTHQETCLDGFEKVDSDAVVQMKQLLNASMEMTSNSLAMVAEISIFLESAMGIQGASGSRRLLSEQDLVVEEYDSWIDAVKRRFLTVPAAKIRPDIIVAKDGSGRFKTINEALLHIPKNNNKAFVLYIKEGVYAEQVMINTSFTNLMIMGDGPTKTRITGNLNFVDGVGTYRTATVAVQGDDFIARDIGFENAAGAVKLQAVALRVSSDRSIFYNCHIDAYQDTLYAHAYRQYYKDCVISGTIDFVFGDSASVFQGCTLLFRKPLATQQNIVTAHGRKDARQPTALVLQNCTFKADAELEPVKHQVKSYLGRPWKEFSRTIIMESFLDDFIQPDGWMPWEGEFGLQTLFYTEFNNRGPAAPKAQRVKWPGVKELPPARIKRFTAGEFLDGNRWIPKQKVPYAAGFIFPVPKEDPNIKYSPVSTEETKDLGSIADRKRKLPLPQHQGPAAAPGFSPHSSIAASPMQAASPYPLGYGTDATAPVGNWDSETGELFIDLSPAPASEAPILPPAESPRAGSLRITPALTPTPAASPPAVTPGRAPATSSPPTAVLPSVSPTALAAKASAVPSVSPTAHVAKAGAVPSVSPTAPAAKAAAAPSPSGGSAPPPLRTSLAGPPESKLSPQAAEAPTFTGGL